MHPEDEFAEWFSELEVGMSLEMRTLCERCHTAELRPDGPAWICSYECTFCETCTAAMNQNCPNCGGELVIRPRRRA